MNRASKQFALCTAFVLFATPLFAASDLEGAMKSLAESLVKDLRGRTAKKLAALDFRDIRGYRSALDPFIAEELVTQIMLIAPGEFTFIERRQLDRIIAEQRLTSSAFFDRDSLAEIGKVLGVDAVLTGTIADLGSTVKITARAVAVQTGQVFSAAAANAPKDGAVAELLRQTVGPLSDAPLQRAGGVPPSGVSAPPQVQASDVFFENHLIRITVGSAALSANKRSLTLSLVIENIGSSDVPLWIPFANATGGCELSITDNQGNLMRARSFDVTGVPCMYDFEVTRGTPSPVLTARSRTTLVARFSSREQIGNVLSLGLELQTLDRDKVKRFSAGLTNIQAR